MAVGHPGNTMYSVRLGVETFSINMITKELNSILTFTIFAITVNFLHKHYLLYVSPTSSTPPLHIAAIQCTQLVDYFIVIGTTFLYSSEIMFAYNTPIIHCQTTCTSPQVPYPLLKCTDTTFLWILLQKKNYNNHIKKAMTCHDSLIF